ncbi:MAG TPA: diphthine synthase [Nitrososphaeraceae archaeon]|jgi:diphthine synthase
MLWFIGLGIYGYQGLSLYAINILKNCKKIFVERFTSEISDDDLIHIHELVDDGGTDIISVKRWVVEDGRIILGEAKHDDIALLSYGDPLIATTHLELFLRAKKNSIEMKVIHAASGLTSLVGESGLDFYKCGRSVTMMSDPQSAISVYNVIHDNLLAGNHTLILTEYAEKESGKPLFLDPAYALEVLLEVENDLKYGIMSHDAFAIIASRIGTNEKNIISGKIRSLTKLNFGQGPHSMIITGRLHFMEEDCIINLTNNLDKPSDNTLNVYRLSVKMIERYAPKAKLALENLKKIVEGDKGTLYNKGILESLDNAEHYIYDAERFMGQGKLELAVLSIGYAEGLIDASRFQMGVNPWS